VIIKCYQVDRKLLTKVTKSRFFCDLDLFSLAVWSFGVVNLVLYVQNIYHEEISSFWTNLTKFLLPQTYFLNG